tara:strand:+ start:1000 stop:1263 length:264 start_codon:yes stop_codon:yes gene_type:complete
MSRFWYWLLSLFKKEYEVTVWFEGSTVTNPDGTKEVGRDPKTYLCRNIVKITPKHIKLILTTKELVEIKTVNPVGYDIKTRKWSPPS